MSQSLSKKRLHFEAKRCIGCRLCEQWCSFSHFRVTNPGKARIRITRSMESQEESAEYCHQCPDAPCIAACNFDALARDELTGAIRVDREKCTGCRLCLIKCPYHAPILEPGTKKILICDLCGGEPVCAAHCPENAIMYSEGEGPK
jgi:Fe-S-cluster-containing hydrogenase component 2